MCNNASPRWYILRNGKSVPLIPYDELPYTLDIEEDKLDYEQMTLVEQVISEPLKYSGRDGRPTDQHYDQEKGEGIREILANTGLLTLSELKASEISIKDKQATSGTETNSARSFKEPGYTATKREFPECKGLKLAKECASTATGSNDGVASKGKDTNSAVTGKKGINGGGSHRARNNFSNKNQKNYCTYWMRTGECDYAQQGCLYKHEFPVDRETLQRCGFSRIPQWYRNQMMGTYYLAGREGQLYPGSALINSRNGGRNFTTDRTPLGIMPFGSTNMSTSSGIEIRNKANSDYDYNTKGNMYMNLRGPGKGYLMDSDGSITGSLTPVMATPTLITKDGICTTAWDGNINRTNWPDSFIEVCNDKGIPVVNNYKPTQGNDSIKENYEDFKVKRLNMGRYFPLESGGSVREDMRNLEERVDCEAKEMLGNDITDKEWRVKIGMPSKVSRQEGIGMVDNRAGYAYLGFNFNVDKESMFNITNPEIKKWANEEQHEREMGRYFAQNSSAYAGQNSPNAPLINSMESIKKDEPSWNWPVALEKSQNNAPEEIFPTPIGASLKRFSPFFT